MRVLVISDIHSNCTALEAVLAGAGTVDEIWCLGDLVGYGPDPNAVVSLLRGLPNLTCLLGNHDVAVIGKMPFETFNGEARRSLVWTETQLSTANMEFLHTLPRSSTVRGDATLAHGSPRDPLWEYVLNTLSARLNFDHFHTPWCFVGHSHIQCLFRLDQESDRITLEVLKENISAPLAPRLILNPGSVGQPRDRDARSAYAIYDTSAQTWTPHRASYNISEVQRRIRDANLPEKHALRLSEGW
jgi:diadenosine tetraphosphatase ApaH/serine/threonine PP2A family protein phosphatase